MCGSQYVFVVDYGTATPVFKNLIATVDTPVNWNLKRQLPCISIFPSNYSVSRIVEFIWSKLWPCPQFYLFTHAQLLFCATLLLMVSSYRLELVYLLSYPKRKGEKFNILFLSIESDICSNGKISVYKNYATYSTYIFCTITLRNFVFPTRSVW